jgi:hypothetical protein
VIDADRALVDQDDSVAAGGQSEREHARSSGVSQ